MKHKNTRKRTIRKNGLRIGNGKRNLVRNPLSGKAKVSGNQAKPETKNLPENKFTGGKTANNLTKPQAAKQKLLRLLPKPKDKKTEELSTVESDHVNPNEEAVQSKNHGASRLNNPKVSGLVAAVLLLAMLVTAALSSVNDAKANEESTELASSQTSSLQLSKEYIYAGSRMLAIEDYGVSSGTTQITTPTPTATPTATPTPNQSASENVVWQNIQGTIPDGNAVSHAGTDYYGFARSQQTITAAGYFEWTFTGFSDVWVGLGNNDDELPANAEGDLSYHISGGDIREMGVYKTDVSVAVGDTLRIEIAADGTVTYKRNGSLLYTSQTPASGSYYLAFKSAETTGHGINNAIVGSLSGSTPTPTPTPTITPTPTPTPSSGQAIIFDGNNFGEVTLPNSAPFNSLGGFQMIWRIRNAANHQPDDLPGHIFNLSDIWVLAAEAVGDPSRFDVGFPQRSGDTPDDMYMLPTDFSDSICKLQYDPTNSRWTFETWKADGTGYVLRTSAIQNTSNFNFGGQTLDLGASNFQHRKLVGKLDYWRWIQRVEPLGVFPSAAPPTGVTYLLDYEFDGNGNDSSGNGLNLTLSNNPGFENTP